MKNVLVGVLILGSFSSFAETQYRDCKAVALELAREATEMKCFKENGYKADSHTIASLRPLHDSLEGTLAQITYYCEAGQGLLVLMSDNRGDSKRKELLCKKGLTKIIHVGAWE